jgi:drug/metabolite transporter (DMT)-like permease
MVAKVAEPSRSFIAVHLIACSLTWGSSFLIIKLIGDGLSPPVLASLRALGAAIILCAVVFAMGRSVLPKGREWQDWLVLGTVNGWVPNILVAYALQRMDSGPGALIQASGPLMVAVLGHFFLVGERLTLARIVGILVGLIGVVLLIGPKAMAGGAATMAVVAMVVLTFGYAIGSIYARTIPNAEPLRMALGQQMVSAVFATLVVLVTVGPVGYGNASTFAGLLVFLSVVCTAIPIWIFMRLISRAGPTNAAMAGYLVPAVAMVLGILVLNEPIVMTQVLGGLIVFVGVSIVTGLLRLPVRKTA